MKNITFTLPSLTKQKRIVFENQMEKNIGIAKENLNAARFKTKTEFDESAYSDAHLNDKNTYEPPHCELVAYYFEQLKAFDSRYTDKIIGWEIFGMTSESADRAVRRYRNGERKISFELWQKFLIRTGRKPQELYRVVAYFE